MATNITLSKAEGILFDPPKFAFSQPLPAGVPAWVEITSQPSYWQNIDDEYVHYQYNPHTLETKYYSYKPSFFSLFDIKTNGYPVNPGTSLEIFNENMWNFQEYELVVTSQISSITYYAKFMYNLVYQTGIPHYYPELEFIWNSQPIEVQMRPLSFPKLIATNSFNISYADISLVDISSLEFVYSLEWSSCIFPNPTFSLPSLKYLRFLYFVYNDLTELNLENLEAIDYVMVFDNCSNLTTINLGPTKCVAQFGNQFSFAASGTPLNQATVDSIIIWCDNLDTDNGMLQLVSLCSPPSYSSPTVAQSLNNLLSKGWSMVLN